MPGQTKSELLTTPASQSYWKNVVLCKKGRVICFTLLKSVSKYDM